MSEQRPQKQNEEQPNDISEELLDDDQILDESAGLEAAEDLDAQAPHEESSHLAFDTPTWTDVKSVKVGPGHKGSIFEQHTPAVQTAETPGRDINFVTVDNNSDKGFEKGNRTRRPEEDVDAAREEVAKSLKAEESKETTVEEPTREERAATASSRISETAHTAARPVKGKAARAARRADRSRNSVNEKTAEAAAKKAAQAEAPVTPPIMGERDGATEKPAKQTVVSEGTDGQQYVTEPTTEAPKSARVPKEAATEARPVPETVIPTNEPVAEEPKKVHEGIIISPETTSRDQYDADLKAAAAAAGYEDLQAREAAPRSDKGKKSEPVAEAPRTTTEEIDEDVLAAMGGNDTGRPAKRGRSRKARPEEETTEAVATPVEPVAEPEAPRRPSPADMPGARSDSGRRPSPADMPRRRTQAEAVNEAAPVTEPTSEAPAATPEVEEARENLKLTGAMETRVSDRYLEASDNEDRAMVNPEKGYMGVFDGMGGHAKGGEAAEAARDFFEEKLANRPNFADIEEAKAYTESILLEAHRMIEEAGKDDGEHKRATTANFAFTETFDDGNYAIVGNVGDSLMYHVDASNRMINQVTANQSINDPTSSHPERFNFVTNSLGGTDKPYNPVDSETKGAWALNDEIVVVKLNPGDKLVSVSDGITGDAKSEELTPEEFRDAFSQSTPEELAKRLIEVSTGLGKKTDDKTVSVLFVNSESALKPESDDKKPTDDEILDGLDFEAPSDLEADMLATAGDRDTRTPEEVEADDAAAEAAKVASSLREANERGLDSYTDEAGTWVRGEDGSFALDPNSKPIPGYDPDVKYSRNGMRSTLGNRFGGFGDRSRNLGAAALGGEDAGWADNFFNGADDLEEERDPWDTYDGPDFLSDAYAAEVAARARAEADDNHDDNDSKDNDDDEPSSGSLADDLLGDFGEPEPARRRTRRERVGTALRNGWNRAGRLTVGNELDGSLNGVFRTGWDKARTYFTGRDLDGSTPDRDRRATGRRPRVLAGAVGATVLAGALFSGLAGDTNNEGPTHVGKGPSASAEKTPGAKVDSGKTETKPEAKPSESATGSDKKESKPSSDVQDDHRYEHGTGTPDISHTFDVGRETVKVSADNEVVVTLKQGGTVWDALDKIGDELHINHSDEDIAETVQSMHLKPGQDRKMKVGSSYTFKVQGGKLVAKK